MASGWVDVEPTGELRRVGECDCCDRVIWSQDGFLHRGYRRVCGRVCAQELDFDGAADAGDFLRKERQEA